MPERYVVGVDGSGPSEAARAWATDRAERSGVPLVLVHVEGDEREQDAYPPRQRLAWPEPDAAVVRLSAPVPDALARFVREDDVLVIGTGKTGFIHARVYGARGIQIAAAVRSSVAIIPEIDLRFRSGVVAGIDGGRDVADVAAVAAAEAAVRDEPLEFIRSMPVGSSAGRRLSDETDHVIAVAESTVRRGWPKLAVRARVTGRPAAEALLDAARNASLLVLGSGDAGAAAPLGHVLHDVLVNANAPVLILR